MSKTFAWLGVAERERERERESESEREGERDRERRGEGRRGERQVSFCVLLMHVLIDSRFVSGFVLVCDDSGFVGVHSCVCFVGTWQFSFHFSLVGTVACASTSYRICLCMVSMPHGLVSGIFVQLKSGSIE